MNTQSLAIQRIRQFFNDPEYYGQMFRIALPIMLQNLLMASLNMINSLMVGQLGEKSVAAVGLGSQVFFILNMIGFGIMSGASVFTAQLWGKKDIHNIRRVVGFAVKLGLIFAFGLFFVTLFFPEKVMSIYTNDPDVIRLGSDFIRIQSWTYPLFVIIMVYYGVTRTTGNVKTPMISIILTLTLNTVLVYIFVFGKFGIEPMGVRGPAVSQVIARIFEISFILYMTYRNSENPTAARWRDFIDFDFSFIKAVIKPVTQVLFNELIWSLGITTYSIIYAHISTNSIAAINIISPIDQLAFVVFFGIGNATSIILGNLIGQGQAEKAYRYGGKSLILQGVGGGIMGLVMLAVSGSIFKLYHVDPQVIELARRIIVITACATWLRSSNHVMIIGIMRAGGDTRFTLLLDAGAVWLVAVPLAAIGAFVLKLPVYWVYALALSEEILKFIFFLRRYFSRKWIRNLTTTVEAVSPAELAAG